MEFIRKHFRKLAYTALGIVILVTGLSIYELRKISFDYDFESFFPLDDPDLPTYQAFRDTFEYDNEFILLSVYNEKGNFQHDFLSKVADLTDSLKTIKDVIAVTSPSTMETVDMSGVGRTPLIHIYDPAALPIDSVNVYNSPGLVGSFFGRDGKSVCIYIKTTEAIKKTPSDSLLMNIQREIDRQHFDHVYSASKARGQKVYLDRLSGEFLQFFVASFLLIVLFLFISFRSFWGVWVPITIVLLSIVWTLGLMTATGKALDIMTVLLPTMMFVVGMSDVVHIVTKYIEELRNNPLVDKFDALIKTLKETGFATFITLLTTSLGFLTLINSKVIPIRDFGIYTSLGVFIAFILSYSIMPVVLYLLPKPKMAEKPITSDFWSKRLHKLLLWIFRNAKTLTVGTIIVLGASIYGITQIQVNNYLIEGLTRKDELRTDFEYFEKNYSGVRPFEILITPKDSTHSLWEPAELRAIDKLEQYLEKDFGVGFMFSPATLVKGFNRVQHGNNNEYYSLPANDSDIVAAVEQIKDYKQARAEVRKLITKNGNQARLTGKMPDIGSKAFRERSIALTAFAENDPAMKAIDVRITGAALMFDKNNQYLVDNTIQGLFLSILVVALIIAFVHRNWRMMVIAVIPNLIPIIIIGGIMGYFGIEMKSATSIIFSIAFGIATDDTIHFLARLKLEMKQGKSVIYCVKRSFLSTGKAVIVTSLILCGGFFSLISSGFESTFYFGLLVSITLFVAVVTDLLLFPLLVVWLIKHKKLN